MWQIKEKPRQGHGLNLIFEEKFNFLNPEYL